MRPVWVNYSQYTGKTRTFSRWLNKKLALNLEWYSPFCMTKRKFLVFLCLQRLFIVSKKQTNSQRNRRTLIRLISFTSLVDFCSQFWHLYLGAVTSFAEFGSIPWQLYIGAMITSSLFYTSWQYFMWEHKTVHTHMNFDRTPWKNNFYSRPRISFRQILLIIHVVNRQI